MVGGVSTETATVNRHGCEMNLFGKLTSSTFLSLLRVFSILLMVLCITSRGNFVDFLYRSNYENETVKSMQCRELSCATY